MLPEAADIDDDQGISSRSLEFAKPLLGLHSSFDRAMILLDDVVQILDGSVATPAAERPFFFMSAMAAP